MRFGYTPYGGNWPPLIPVAFANGAKRLPPVRALVDTGATHTLLPLDVASELGIRIDINDRLESQVAGGAHCFIYPSPVPVHYHLRDPAGESACRWRGQVFFVLEQEFVLLGHHQCLEKFDVTFHGPEKQVQLRPRFRTASAE